MKNATFFTVALTALFAVCPVFAEEEEVIDLDVDIGEVIELDASDIEIVEEEDDAAAGEGAREGRPYNSDKDTSVGAGRNHSSDKDTSVGAGRNHSTDNDTSVGAGLAPALAEDEIEIVEGELEKMPEIIEFVEAAYPEEFVKSGVEGSVIFELLVSETGAVDSITVVKSLIPALDTSALEAVRKFKFSPAMAGGEAVAVMLQYEYRFNLRDVVSIPESYVNYSGRLIERGTRKPVIDAQVVLKIKDAAEDKSLNMPLDLYMEQIGKIEGQTWEDGFLFTTTDERGNFKFYSLPSCKVEMRVLSPDYESYTTEENISRLEEVSGVYYISRLDYSDYELVVYGKVEEKEVSRRQLDIAEVKRIPGLGGEALRVVQALPGVGRARFGGNDVVVRGLPSWASRYFIDGVSVPLLYHLGGNNSSYPSEAVEAVDFYPGGFSARYGGATVGIIEMRSRKPKTDRLQGYVDLSNLDGAVFIEGPVNERVSFMASGRRGFLGDIMSFLTNNFDLTGLGVTAAPYYWDFLLRTNVKINEDNDLFVTVIGSRDSLGVYVPIAMGGSPEIDEVVDQLNMKILFYTLIGGLDSRLSDRWKNSLRLSASYIGQDMSAMGMARMDNSQYMTHLRNQLTYKASDKLTVNVGADLQLVNVDMEIAMITGQNMILTTGVGDAYYGIVGGYATLEWKPIDRLLLVPGIRFDYYPELDYSGSLVPAFWDYGIIDNRRGVSGEPALRVSGRYEYKDGHTAKAAVGTYSQSPEPMGLVIHETFGEPDLPATKAAQYVAGYEWQINELLNLDVQGYYNYMWDAPRSYDNRIDYDQSRTDAGINQRNFFSDSKARTYGLELMLRHNRSEDKNFFGWISYTLSRSESWSKIDDKYILSSRDEPHYLQLLGSWRLKNNWEVGTRVRYVSGKPSSPIVATVESENGNRINPIYGELNSTRMDPFFQADVRFDKRYVYDKWMLTYYVDLQNVLWSLYKSPEFTFYNYNYTKNQKISMIPMIASGVRAEF